MFKIRCWSEIISLFPWVDTRLIPYIVKHTIYLRYLHTIYILYTILQYNTPNSSKSKPFKHTVPYTHHTKHTPSFPFTLLFYPSISSSIILFLLSLFFLLLHYLLIIIIIIIVHRRPTTDTLPPLSLPQTRPIHPTHSLPSTYILTILINMILYENII